MTLCKNCGTVYDEFYGVCPKCGTPCEADAGISDSLPPIGKLPTNNPAGNSAGTLPPIDIAIKNSGETGVIPLPDDPDKTIPSPSFIIPTIDPDAAIPVKHPIDPDATIPVKHPIDPDATIPVQHPIDPDATIPVKHPIDPDATIPVQHPIDPDATIPVQHPIDPDATIPVKHTIDPDATIPVKHPIDPDATIPVQHPIDPDATIPAKRNIVQQDSISRTQEIPYSGNQQYGDEYNTSAIHNGNKDNSPKKKRSAGKIIAIILIIAVVLGGCGVGTYFLFFNKKPQDSASEPTAKESSTSAYDVSDPETLRSYARSMNMAIINLYAGIYNGTVNADAPSNELRGLNPSKLPKAGATPDDRESAANALTIQDVITYANISDKFNAATIGYFVYDGAEVYYRDDHSGTPLTPDTTIGDFRGVKDEPSQVTEPSVQESSVPEPSQVSEPSEVSQTPVIDTQLNAALLSNACKDLYAEVAAGTLNSSDAGKITPSKLPSATASAGLKRRYANALTVADAIAYADLENTFNSGNIGDYVYDNGQIFPKDTNKGTPLTLNTTLADAFGIQVTSQTESSVEESSQTSEVSQSSDTSQSSEPSQAEGSTSPTSEPSAETNPRMAELAGKWEMTFNTSLYSEDELKQYREIVEFDEFVILLNADGTASAYTVIDGATDILGTGAWTVNGNNVSVTIDGDTEEFIYANDHLNIDAYGDIAYFSKN